MKIYERVLNKCKSIYVNYKVFPREIAKKQPLYISYRTRCEGLYRGCIEIRGDIYTGMIQYGHKAVSLPGGKSLLSFAPGGKLIFGGKADFTQGIHICIFQNAELRIGNNLFANTNTIIHCHKHVQIGSDNMWGWNLFVTDGDGHPIRDAEGQLINQNRPVVIGDNVWLGSYTKVLKGAEIADGCVVGLGSIVTGKHTIDHTILVGNPLRTCKQDIKWDRGEFSQE